MVNGSLRVALGLLILGSFWLSVLSYGKDHAAEQKKLADEIEKQTREYEGRFGKRPALVDYRKTVKVPGAELGPLLEAISGGTRVGEVDPKDADRQALTLETRLKELSALYTIRQTLEMIDAARKLDVPIAETPYEKALRVIADKMEAGEEYLTWLPERLEVGDRNIALDHLKLLASFLFNHVKAEQRLKAQGKKGDPAQEAAEKVGDNDARVWDLSLDTKKSRLPKSYVDLVSDKEGAALFLQRFRMTTGKPKPFLDLAEKIINMDDVQKMKKQFGAPLDGAPKGPSAPQPSAPGGNPLPPNAGGGLVPPGQIPGGYGAAGGNPFSGYDPFGLSGPTEPGYPYGSIGSAAPKGNAGPATTPALSVPPLSGGAIDRFHKATGQNPALTDKIRSLSKQPYGRDEMRSRLRTIRDSAPEAIRPQFQQLEREWLGGP